MIAETLYLFGGGVLALVGLVIGSIKYTHSVKDNIHSRIDREKEALVTKDTCENEKFHIDKQLSSLNEKTIKIESDIQKLLSFNTNNGQSDVATRKTIFNTEKKLDLLLDEMRRLKSE